MMSLMISVSYVYRICVFVCVLCTVLHHSVQNTEILHVILFLKLQRLYNVQNYVYL